MRTAIPIVADPGADFVKVPLAITNLQTDRSAAIDTPLNTVNFFVAPPASPAFSHTLGSALNSVDCSSNTVPVPPAGVCLIERADFDGSHFAFRDNGDHISIGFDDEALIGSGQRVNVIIYSGQGPSGAPLPSLLLHATGPDVTHQTQISLP